MYNSHVQNRLRHSGAPMYVNVVYHVIITISTWRRGVDLEVKRAKRPASSRHAEMPISDTSCIYHSIFVTNATTKPEPFHSKAVIIITVNATAPVGRQSTTARPTVSVVTRGSQPSPDPGCSFLPCVNGGNAYRSGNTCLCSCPSQWQGSQCQGVSHFSSLWLTLKWIIRLPLCFSCYHGIRSFMISVEALFTMKSY